MTEFSLTKHPAMILAPGASKQVGDRVTETTGTNSRVLLVCDPALVELGLAGPVTQSLTDAGHTVTVFDDLQSLLEWCLEQPDIKKQNSTEIDTSKIIFFDFPDIQYPTF